MLAAVDAQYGDRDARVASVTFAAWADGAPASERAIVVEGAALAPYQPGEFWRRELPCLRAVLAGLAALDVVIVDGYVWLGVDRPGLGARLYDELGGTVKVVGVAKTPFRDAPAVPVIRGESKRPLFVTAAGIDADEAAARVASMHGDFRLPTLLRRVDQLSRA